MIVRAPLVSLAALLVASCTASPASHDLPGSPEREAAGPSSGESIDRYQSALTAATHCFGASGTTLNVTAVNDELNSDGDCSLREAIVAANTDSPVDACPAGNGTDTIVLPAGTFNLTIPGASDTDGTQGDLDITDGVTISGAHASATTISGLSADNVFQISTAAPVCFDRVTISDGYRGIYNPGGTAIIRRSAIVSNRGSWAGGILNNHGGTMTIEDSIVEGNDADYGAGILNGSGVGTSYLVVVRSTLRHNDASGWGGGLMSTGIVHVIDSAVHDNSASVGGGLFNDNGGSVMTVLRSTVSGNNATYGGGLFNDSSGNPTLIIDGATITDNAAGWGGGGGIHARGTVRMGNTILADNRVSGGAGPECVLTIESTGYNLIGNPIDCQTTGNTSLDITGVSPQLVPLADNGGPTATHALLAGSPAIDAIPDGASDCRAGVSGDQRGARRAGGQRLGETGCDIGAFEALSNGGCADSAFAITVTTTDDELNSDGDCSLREAVVAANTDTPVDACPAGSGADTISLPAGHYQLAIAGDTDSDGTTGDLDITDALTISGAHAVGTRVVGLSSDNVFQVNNNATVCFDNVTLSGGSRGLYNPGGTVTIRQSVVADNHGSWAGGVLNNHAGTMTIEDSIIENNTADYGAGVLNGSGVGDSYLVIVRTTLRGNVTTGWGGGLMSTGIVYVVDSAAYDNHADVGGSLFNDNSGSVMTVVRTTVSGSSATYGGGLFNDSTGNPTMIIEDSTVTDNAAGWGGGGGLYARGTVYMGGTIVYGNSATSGPDCSLTVISNDYNMIGDTANCTLTGATTNNRVGVDPMLDVLSDNGGPTWTHALLAGSPAIDAMPAGTSGCRADRSGDQRGVLRASGSLLGSASCDIGAFEAASNQ